MADFRKWFLAFAILALLSAFAVPANSHSPPSSTPQIKEKASLVVLTAEGPHLLVVETDTGVAELLKVTCIQRYQFQKPVEQSAPATLNVAKKYASGADIGPMRQTVAANELPAITNEQRSTFGGGFARDWVSSAGSAPNQTPAYTAQVRAVARNGE